MWLLKSGFKSKRFENQIYEFKPPTQFDSWSFCVENECKYLFNLNFEKHSEHCRTGEQKQFLFREESTWKMGYEHDL